MSDIFNKLVNNQSVRGARDMVANLPPPVKKVAKAGMIGVGTGVIVFATPPLLGFTASGVAAGSLAATIQSALIGGAVPAGSLFSIMQSIGATATIVPALIAGVSATGIVGAVATGRAQGSEGNEEGKEAKAGFKETDGHKDNGDEGEQDGGEEQRSIEDGGELPGSSGNEDQTVTGSSSACDDSRLQVATRNKKQRLMGRSLNPGQRKGVHKL